jgi:hypothetical protein
MKKIIRLNLGADVGSFKNKITGTIDVLVGRLTGIVYD